MFSSRFWQPTADPWQSSTSSIFESDPFFRGRQQQQQQQSSTTQHQQEEKYQGTRGGKEKETTTQPQQQQQQQQQVRGGVTQQQPQQQQSRGVGGGIDESQMMMSPWSIGGGGGLGLFDDPFRSMWSPWGIDRDFARMNRLMQQRLASTGDELERDPNASSYSVSSSSYTHTGADGKPVTSHSTRRERRRLGDVIEENEHYVDGLGNERMKTRRGVANKVREVIRDRNADGEERKFENLQGIGHDEIEQFDQQWNEAMKKYESQRQLLGSGVGTFGGGQQQQSITSGNTGGNTNEQARITSTSGKTTPPTTTTTTGAQSKQQQHKEAAAGDVKSKETTPSSTHRV